MKFFILICTILSILLIQGIQCLVVEDIREPKMVVLTNDDDNENIIIDCGYELRNNGSFLVVKWFRGNDIMYQWIRGQEPSVFPKFKGLVNDTYEISEDPNKQYRGLVLQNPSIESNGTYKCIVQTDEDTASLEKHIQIIDVQNYTLHLERHQIQNETHLECVVDGVYPEPKLHFTTDDEDEVSEPDIVIKTNGSYYYVKSVAMVNDDDDDDDEYTCIVTFKNFPFNLTTAITGGSAGTQTLARILLATFMLIVLII